MASDPAAIQAFKDKLKVGQYVETQTKLMYLGQNMNDPAFFMFYDLNAEEKEDMGKKFPPKALTQLKYSYDAENYWTTGPLKFPECSEETLSHILTSEEFGYSKTEARLLKSDPSFKNKLDCYVISKDSAGNFSATIPPDINALADDSFVYTRPKKSMLGGLLGPSRLSATDVKNCQIMFKSYNVFRDPSIKTIKFNERPPGASKGGRRTRKGRRKIRKNKTNKRKHKHSKKCQTRRKNLKGGTCYGSGVGSNNYDPNLSVYNTRALQLFPYKPN